MGFTPLEGLVMGTRSGDIDPAIIDFISVKEGLSAQQVETLLNKQSGLLGISGLTHDMRELLDEERENNDRRSHLAIEIFCYRARKYLGAFWQRLEVRMRSSSLEASAKTLRRFVPEYARGWNGWACS